MLSCGEWSVWWTSKKHKSTPNGTVWENVCSPSVTAGGAAGARKNHKSTPNVIVWESEVFCVGVVTDRQVETDSERNKGG